MLKTTTIDVIKSTIPLLETHGRQITDVFYDNLFTNHPYLMNIFNMANQSAGSQSRALSDAIVAYAKNIENIEALLPVVARIAHKHVSLGVKAKHYALVGENLLIAIAHVLSLPADHPALTAWGEAYGLLADVFINAEKNLYLEGHKQDGGWVDFRDFYIERIVDETPEVKTFYLQPIDLETIPNFKGGQYVGVKVRPDGQTHDQIRQYSLSQKGAFRITVKAEHQGTVSNYLHQCKPHDPISLQVPTGVFTLDETKDEQKKHIFIAGGVGITPLMSMMQEAIENGANGEDVLFIQCAKDPEHQIFKCDLANLITANTGLKHKLCYENSSCGDHEGYLSEVILEKWLNESGFNNQNAHVYFCGPKSFMAVLNQFFVRLGFPESHIHYEVFGPTINL